jgi:hypothetical protein
MITSKLPDLSGPGLSWRTVRRAVGRGRRAGDVCVLVLEVTYILHLCVQISS